MDNLLEQVEAARRRMVRNEFAVRFAWWLFAALAAAAVAIAAPKVVAIEGLPSRWAEGWLVGAGVVAIAGAGVATYRRRSGAIDAAVEIDRRFDLRERVASSLSLPESEHGSEIGRALIDDAARSVAKIDIREEFPLRVGRRAWLPVVPAAAAFVLMIFVGDQPPAEATSQDQAAVASERVKKSVEELRKKIAQKVKENEGKEELKDATDLLKEVQQGVEEVTKHDDASRKEATVKLNDLAKQLEERRKQLGGAEAVRKELEKLDNLGKGPAEKAADAMKQGDWDKALKEIEQLRKQMADGKLSAEQQQKLAEQLGKLKQQLDAANQARKQAEQDLKKQIEEQRRKGNLDEAAKLQEKLDQLQQQKEQQQKLEGLAEKLGQAQQAMQNGDPQAAAEAMGEMAEQLEQMQQEIDQLEMLDQAMDQIEQAKQAMGCQQCQGSGCEACGAQGQADGGQGQGDGEGDGMGEGRGRGPRPDEENPTSMRDTRVRQDPGRGDSTFGGQVKGPNTRGVVRETVKGALDAEESADAEALDEQRLPRSRREHAREYFEKLREEL